MPKLGKQFVSIRKSVSKISSSRGGSSSSSGT